jgi:hypothetical protein
MSLGKGSPSQPVMTEDQCEEDRVAHTTFKSLPAYDDLLTSLRNFVVSNSPGPWKWRLEFRHTALTSNETLKDLTSAIAH